jgi:hypothetical protein
MKFRFDPHCVNVKFVARLLGAAILLVVLLANFASPHLFAAAKTCQLACCKGMSPHSEDDCAGGSCHLKQPKLKTSETEEFCGSARSAARIVSEWNRTRQNSFVKKLKIAALYDDAADEDDSSDKPKFAAPVMRQPCRPDCRATNFNFGNQNRSPEKGAFFALAAFSRPLNDSASAFYRRQFVFISRLLPRDTQSRAPPVSRF